MGEHVSIGEGWSTNRVLKVVSELYEEYYSVHGDEFKHRIAVEEAPRRLMEAYDEMLG